MEEKKHYIGLSDAEVLASKEKNGENLLSPPLKSPVWKLFLEKFNDPIIRILLIAAFLSLGISVLHHEYAETIGIFCAIFLATGIAFWFERDADNKFDVLNQVNDDELVMVVRNNNVCQIAKKNIVVGDIVLLETGNEVPADGILLDATSLQLDESTLTGEPSVDKSSDPNHSDQGATYPSNCVLRSTKVINGHGTCRIVNVGDATEFGKVAQKSTETVEGETPLNKQLDILAKFISIVGLSLAVLTFSVLFVRNIFFDPDVSFSLSQLGLLGAVLTGIIIGLSKMWVPIFYGIFDLIGKPRKLPNKIENWSWLVWIILGFCSFAVLVGIGCLWGVDPADKDSWISLDVAENILQYFMIAVTLVVVAVPEGLPMSVTLSLAMSMRRMLKMNNLVRKMHACETMGAVTVICTDKTGTLTQNQMQVYNTNFYCLSDMGQANDENHRLIYESIAVNSTAFLDFSNLNKVVALGNPTEGALLLWLNSKNINYLNIREDVKVIGQLPFSTERKYMATVVVSKVLNKMVIYLKGAPEVILARCGIVRTETGLEDANLHRQSVDDQLLRYQNQAMRTLGFAYQVLENGYQDIVDIVKENNFIFLGIAAISDPVRPDVPHAVDECLHAGIEVKIVTGDTYGTAREIGREIGIWDDNDTDYNIISGVDFENLSDADALDRVGHLKIMCRARPTDKQRLVSLLKRKHEIVAVTGDGTNDAPALNFADVGLSMGSGTSVAKEASDITLLDDSFSSIATAVMWGRSLYQNIQRFILFQVTINLAALLIVFLGSIFGKTVPLTVTQMLWVNLIMDTFAAGALASLPPNPEVMNDKPRKNSDFIISPLMAKWIFGYGLSFVVFLIGMISYFDSPLHLDSFFSYIAPVDRERYFLSYFFTVFVLFQFWNMFNAKAFLTGRSAFRGIAKSFGFELIAVVILLGQFIIVTFGGEIFRTMPLLARDWIVIIAGTSTVLWIGELVRLLAKK